MIFSGKITAGALLASGILLCGGIFGQSSIATPQPTSRIALPIDESKVVTLHGNTRPEAKPAFDKGRVDAQLSMERMLLILQRSPEQEAALEGLMQRQLDPGSPEFHQWLSPEDFGALYGPSDLDIQIVTAWLQSHGFSVEGVSKGRTFLQFSGTAGVVQQAFHTEIHRYVVRGEEHIANSSDPAIPASLSPIVAGIVSLNNFEARPLHDDLGTFRRDPRTGKWMADNQNLITNPLLRVVSSYGTFELVTPYDFATIYNVAPLWTAGIDGTGQAIAIAGRSDISLTDVATFRSSFGLDSSNVPNVIINGADPGYPTAGDRLENTLDVEWSGAIAKAATIDFVTTKSTNSTDGAFASALYIIDNKIAPVMSFSYGLCELYLGTSGNAAYNSLWQQGAAEGISEFVASGDWGAATCDAGGTPPYTATNGFAVNGISSTPYDIAVGGTDLNWANNSGTTYWNSTNVANGSNARGYMPEVPWNATCVGDAVDQFIGGTSLGLDEEQTCQTLLNDGIDLSLVSVTGGGGGVSACTSPSGSTPSSCAGGYAKPVWQTGTGVPADGKRDVPDVSLFAANGVLGSAYIMCDSQSTPCSFSIPDDAVAQGVGGTSVSSPAMAGIMALVNQKAGSPQGNANAGFYALAARDTRSSCNTNTVAAGNACNFYDITTDDIAVPCSPGSFNCTVHHSGDAVGVLDGYRSTTGYDLTSGLGTINAANLVNNWHLAQFAPATMISPAPGSTLTGPSTTFTWTTGSGVSSYYLWIGATAGGNDLYQAAISGTSTTVNLPTSGATVYVRLWSVINNGLQYQDYTYTEFSPVAATMVSPAPGSTLTGSSTAFTWTAGSNVSSYYLWIGTTAGGNDLYQAAISGISTTVDLPTSGATVYVRLWSVINGGLQYHDYTYTEFSPVPAAMVSPAPGSTLTGSSTTFTWTAGSGVSAYSLWVGTTAGGNDLYQAVFSGTSTTINLPTNGVTIYVRLWSVINGGLQFHDYTYTEFSPVPATMISPAPGSTLTGSSTTFTWTAGSGVSAYSLWVGTTAGGNDLYQAVFSGTSTTVNLPTNGVTIYVRLWSVINGGLQFHDYTYTEF